MKCLGGVRSGGVRSGECESDRIRVGKMKSLGGGQVGKVTDLMSLRRTEFEFGKWMGR